jgi:DNA-binding GntR family transcriptional regulator
MIVNNKEKSALRFQAYKAIKDKIIHLELRPGEKIFEGVLAESLNVSRTPVREALLMLEHEKLVVCSDSLGFHVRRFSRKDIREYFALRNAIEEFALSLVMDNVTREEVETLRTNVAAGEKIVASGDIAAIIDCESEFHEIIYKAAKSDLLFETVSALVSRFQWFRALALSVPGAAASSLSQHLKMVDFLEAKNMKGLKKLMRSHLDEAENRILCLPGILL